MIELSGRELTIEQLAAVARGKEQVAPLGDEVSVRMQHSHCLEILENVRTMLAIELITAAQAIDLRPEGPARLGEGSAKVYAEIRKHVAFIEHDRQTTADMQALAKLFQGGSLAKQVFGEYSGK